MSWTRIIALSLCLASMPSCRMAQTAVSAASRASGLGEILQSEGREGVLEMLLAGILGGVRELLQPQREFWLGLAAAIDQLELTDQALEYGIPAAVLLLCATDAPGDFPEEGTSFAVMSEAEGEVGRFRAMGRLGEHALPLLVEVDVDAARSTVTLRGGGWLLCGLSEGDLEVDGEPLDLGEHERLDPVLDVNVWPEPTGEVAVDSAPPSAVEVTLTLQLDHEILAPILDAEQLTVWLADEPVEIFLDGDDALETLRRYLATAMGDRSDAEPEPVSEQDLAPRASGPVEDED